MKRWILASGIAGFAMVALVGTALAAGPNGSGERERLRDTSTISTVLGISHDEIMALRQDGLSLAQIAEQQGVDPEALVVRLTEQAQERIAARVENGGLDPEAAAQLQATVEEQVRARVEDPASGGMGAILGAGNGPAAGNGGEGAPYGTGECDGTGPHGAGS